MRFCRPRYTANELQSSAPGTGRASQTVWFRDIPKRSFQSFSGRNIQVIRRLVQRQQLGRKIDNLASISRDFSPPLSCSIFLKTSSPLNKNCARLGA